MENNSRTGIAVYDTSYIYASTVKEDRGDKIIDLSKSRKEGGYNTAGLLFGCHGAHREI